MNDLRFAWRQLIKAPAFAFVAIVSLALGISACAMTFSWIQSVLVDAVPGAKDPGRLVVLASRQANGQIGDTLSLPDIQDLFQDTQVFQGILASQIEAVTVRIHQEPEWLWAQPITANAFEVLGVRAIAGRTFHPHEDDTPRGNPVVILSHALWQTRFHGQSNVIGQTLEISQRTFTIIGIAPEGFHGTMGGLQMDLWVPVTESNEHEDMSRAISSRGIRWLHTIGRLRDGVTRSQATAAVNAVMKRLESAHPTSNRNIGVAVLPMWKSPWGAQGTLLSLLIALAAMASLLLLLVIANVANLLLARATARDAEMAVRVAVGAGAGRLMRQVLVESVVLASLGGLAGCLAASAFRHALLWFIPTTYLPIRLEFPIDGRVLAFTAILTLFSGLLFGLAPAWRCASANLAETLKAGGRTGTGSRQTQRLRQILVITEVAAAVVLLIGMALCTRSFQKALRLNVGMDPHGIWIAGFRLPQGTYTAAQADEFYKRLRIALEKIPGVDSVAFTDWLPLGFEGGSSTSFSVPGYLPAAGENVEASSILVSSAYFATLRIPLVSGREFDARDGRDAPPVVVINEELARRYFPGRDPLGLKLEVWGKSRTIVGIAKTGKYRSLNEPPRRCLYLPQEQIGDHVLAAILRTRAHPSSLASAVEKAAFETDPNARPVAAMPMTDYMAAAYVLPKTAATLFAVLGACALFLVALGIYGVIATSVGRRTREVGIRMSLGADRTTVLRMFLQQGFRLVGIGIVAGALASFATARVLGQLLIETSVWDPVSFGLALPLLAAVGLAASWLPARRAAQIHPIEALRND